MISFGDALWPSQIKAHGSRSVRSSSPPASSPHPLLLIRFLPLREMSPLRRQSTIFLQSRLTEEHNSGPFWVDGAITSAFRDDTFGLLESAAIPFEDSPALPTEYLLPSFDDDHLGPPSASSGDYERVDSVGFTLDACTMPFGNQSDDLYVAFFLSPSVSGMTTDCILSLIV